MKRSHYQQCHIVLSCLLNNFGLSNVVYLFVKVSLLILLFYRFNIERFEASRNTFDFCYTTILQDSFYHREHRLSR